MKLRKIVTIVEEIRTEGGREVSPRPALPSSRP